MMLLCKFLLNVSNNSLVDEVESFDTPELYLGIVGPDAVRELIYEHGKIRVRFTQTHE